MDEHYKAFAALRPHEGKLPYIIPIGQCIDGHLYFINARNADLGIYKEATKAFTISRHKFSANFLFEEIHWDACTSFGTAIPLRDLGEGEVDESKQLEWLNAKQTEIDTNTMMIEIAKEHGLI